MFELTDNTLRNAFSRAPHAAKIGFTLTISGAHMGRFKAALLGLLAFAAVAECGAAPALTEGRDYFLVSPVQRTSVPAGKVEVMEVFSYGCPACNEFAPVMEKLKKSLPPNAQVVYLPAAFIPSEDWPMLQRAYFAAQALGIADRTHQAMFDAVWKTQELSISDPTTHRLKNPLPSIEDASRWYARTAGVKAEDFLAAAKSFGVDVKMKSADAQIIAMHTDSTPTLIINGKYRLTPQMVGGYDQLVQAVKVLVEKESAQK